jgi:hypothetical protein
VSCAKISPDGINAVPPPIEGNDEAEVNAKAEARIDQLIAGTGRP